MATDLELFIERAADARLHIPLATLDRTPSGAPETVDALFHLPLLALAIMTIARRGPFQTVYLGRRIAALLVEHFEALRNSSHAMETSLTLRRRCVNALVFLEIMGLVTVSRDRRRAIELTDTGKKHLDAARRETSDLGLLVRGLRIAQDRSAARIGIDER